MTERQAYVAGYMEGLMAGIAAGLDSARRCEEAEWAARHHAAYNVVQAMAKMPAHADLERQRRTYTNPITGLAPTYRGKRNR